ncbi:MAG: FAD-dependent oxidoreductase [Bacteroidetes bacterium]|nr:FAD-dependent oxidoreductase [Bacteroidota bacterium]
METNKIIIIGGNAAGPAAAAKAKRFNPNVEVLMIESEEYISTGTCEIPYVLSGEIDSYKNVVIYSPEKFKEEKGVDVLTNHSVESIDKKKKEIIVIDKIKGKNFSVPYDKLILCTGSKANKLEIYLPYKNVFNLKRISDLLKIKNFISDNNVKKVLVVGSGYIGLETAEALKLLGLSVAVFDIAELPFPKSEFEIQNLILECLKNNKVDFYGDAKNIQIISEDEKIKSIKIDGRILEFDLVITAVGVHPNVHLAKDAGLDIGSTGAIKVNNKLKTCNNHIYAAGDNIEVINAITKKPDYIPLATIAHKAGHIAGENAAGGNVFFRPIITNIAVKIFDYYYAQVGLTANESEMNNLNYGAVSSVMPNLVTVMPESKKVFGKIIYDKGTKLILGASFFGGREVSGYADLISSFIFNKINANLLSKIDYNYTPPLSPMINLLSVLGRKLNGFI